MPYKNAKYKHIRQRPPAHFVRGTFRTVPVSHSSYRGKYRKKGVKAVVGRLKRDYRPATKRNRKVWAVQTLLVPV